MCELQQDVYDVSKSVNVYKCWIYQYYSNDDNPGTVQAVYLMFQQCCVAWNLAVVFHIEVDSNNRIVIRIIEHFKIEFLFKTVYVQSMSYFIFLFLLCIYVILVNKLKIKKKSSKSLGGWIDCLESCFLHFRSSQQSTSINQTNKTN